jgi:tetratricopeptide (TPR) repeat protein
MIRWRKWTLSLSLVVFMILSIQVPPIGAATQKEPLLPASLSDLADGNSLFEPIKTFVMNELKLSEEDASYLLERHFYEVNLGYFPTGYTRQFLSFVWNSDQIELVFVATDKDASNIKLLDRAVSSKEGNMFINTAKLDISTQDNHIKVWTQAPFRAFESDVDLDWTGDKLQVISHKYTDPSALFFEQKSLLIQNKDVDGLIKQWNEDYPMYPMFYSDYFTLATPALRLAHQKALSLQKNNLKTAISYLEFGLQQYDKSFIIPGYADGTLTKTDIIGTKDSLYTEDRLSLSAYVGIVNDYAYFLSLSGRIKEAKPILVNVTKLVPNRTVAYLNLADVEWSLGQRNDAKTHYKQYWKLLGTKASTIAPKRVQERITAK